MVTRRKRGRREVVGRFEDFVERELSSLRSIGRRVVEKTGGEPGSRGKVVVEDGVIKDNFLLSYFIKFSGLYPLDKFHEILVAKADVVDREWLVDNCNRFSFMERVGDDKYRFVTESDDDNKRIVIEVDDTHGKDITMRLVRYASILEGFLGDGKIIKDYNTMVKRINMFLKDVYSYICVKSRKNDGKDDVMFLITIDTNNDGASVITLFNVDKLEIKKVK